MRLRRSILRDLALLLLAALTVAAATFVLTREADDVVAAPTPSPSAAPAAPRALVLGSEAVTGPQRTALPYLLADRLGWDVDVDAVPGTGFLTGPEPQRYGPRLSAAIQEPYDVVVLVSNAAPSEGTDGRLLGGQVQSAIGEVRQQLPEAEVVLVAPVSADPAAASLQREVLSSVAARFGAFYVDPIGAGFLTGRPELVTENGVLNAEGARIGADRLAAALRPVLPATLLPDVNGR